MIDVDRFSIWSLWKQALWNFEFDHLHDTQEIIAAIRSHPRFTPAHTSWFQGFLSNLLCDSLQMSSFDWATYLLSEGAEVLNEAAGHAACRGFSDDQKLELFDGFFNNGWDVNSCDEENNPIFCLVTDSEPLIQWFLSHSADTNLMDSNGRRPIDRAAACGSFECVQLLLRHGAKFNSNISLHHAARRRSPDHIALPILSLLLEQNAMDVNASGLCAEREDLPYSTPLHGAVESGSAERVRLLLEKGADPGKEDAMGKTPVDLARQYGYPETERHLLEWLGRYGEEKREAWVLVDDFELLEIATKADSDHGAASCSLTVHTTNL